MAENRIKWKPGEREQIAREVKRFNAKVEREAKKAGNIVPPKMETADVRKMIKSRKDFNAFKKLVENAFKENAFKPGKAGSTKYEQSEVKIRVGIINRRRAEKSHKKPIPEGRMGTESQNMNMPKKPKKLKNLGKHDKDYLESIRFESSALYERMQQDEYFANYAEVVQRYVKDETYLNQILYALSKIPLDAFIEAKENDNEFDIDFVYDQQGAPDLGYKITKGLFNLMDDLNIKHRKPKYHDKDVEAANNATPKAPPEED